MSSDAAGRLRLSHSGGFALGAATTILMLPSERLGIVVLTNAAPIGVPETVAAEFMDLAEFGKIQFDCFSGYSRLFKHLENNPSILAGKPRPAQRWLRTPTTFTTAGTRTRTMVRQRSNPATGGVSSCLARGT